MIPKIIHQTWRDHNLPGPKHWPESWKIQNPNWEYRLWTDDDLLTLVRTHYPDLEELYQSYPNPVQRADLGRYLVLDHCGGVYADLDTECYGALDAIAHEDRIILAQEPTEHFHHAQSLGLGYFLFNGLMVSPKGHPFWQHLFATLKKCKNALARVLESTGPLALSGAYASYRKPEQIAVQSCHIFTPLTSGGRASHAPMSGDYGHLRIANHFWGSSWFSTAKQPRSQGLTLAMWKMRYRLTRGPFITREDARNAVDYSVLHQPVPTHQANVAVLIPVRDASAFLDRCFALLLALDYPHQKIKLVFCEGDSKDDTVAKLTSLADKHRAAFRDILIIHQSNGFAISRDNRWKTKLQ